MFYEQDCYEGKQENEHTRSKHHFFLFKAQKLGFFLEFKIQEEMDK